MKSSRKLEKIRHKINFFTKRLLHKLNRDQWEYQEKDLYLQKKDSNLLISYYLFNNIKIKYKKKILREYTK